MKLKCFFDILKKWLSLHFLVHLNTLTHMATSEKKVTKKRVAVDQITGETTTFNMTMLTLEFSRMAKAASDKGFDSVQALLRVIGKEWLNKRGY